MTEIQTPEIQTRETVFDELASVERDWGHVLYVPFDRRRRVMRYARIGATLEALTEQSDGAVARALKDMIAHIDAEMRP